MGKSGRNKKPLLSEESEWHSFIDRISHIERLEMGAAIEELDPGNFGSVAQQAHRILRMLLLGQLPPGLAEAAKPLLDTQLQALTMEHAAQQNKKVGGDDISSLLTEVLRDAGQKSKTTRRIQAAYTIETTDDEPSYPAIDVKPDERQPLLDDFTLDPEPLPVKKAVGDE